MLQVRESACVLCHLNANFTDFLSTVPIRDLGWSSEGDEPAVALPPPSNNTSPEQGTGYDISITLCLEYRQRYRRLVKLVAGVWVSVSDC